MAIRLLKQRNYDFTTLPIWSPLILYAGRLYLPDYGMSLLFRTPAARARTPNAS